MNITAVVRLCMGAILVIAAGSAFAQELQLNCPLDWSALGDIDGPDQRKIIYGIPAKEWKKEHVEAMVAKEQECSQNSTDATSINDMRADAVAQQLYPNALAAIQRRDERLIQAQALAEHETTQQAGAASTQDVQAPQGASAGTADASSGTTGAALASPPKEADTLQTAPVLAQERVTENTNRVWMGWAALLAVVVAFYWQRFVRNRCTSCRSTHFERMGETELDRWRSTKQVSERNSRGTNTRHVQTTYVKLQFDYCCTRCQNEWSKIRKEELGSDSSVGRFFSGY